MKVYIVNAFGEKENEGNPAGIILDGNNLQDNVMIKISSILNFSESVFIQKSEKADFKIRFFSPTQEVDLCGHGTIATFHTLIKNGKINFGISNEKIVTQETKAGILNVHCYKNGTVIMEQNEPVFGEIIKDKKIVSKLLGLEEKDILIEYPIQIVSTGTPKLLIPIISLSKLFEIKPDLSGIIEFCKQNNVKGFYPFTFETISKKSDFHTRQFNPISGINEDPITGIAAGSLGAYVVNYNILPKNNFVIEQGYIMNKPGKIIVKIDNNKVLVGGKAFIINEIEIGI